MGRLFAADRAIDRLWFLAWVMISSLWCWSSARQLGATYDEPNYVQRGLEGWRDWSHRRLIEVGTMPLPIDIQTLPLFVWERWRGVPIDPKGELERVLPWARAGTLLF
jgi:hypothetical protein